MEPILESPQARFYQQADIWKEAEARSRDYLIDRLLDRFATKLVYSPYPEEKHDKAMDAYERRLNRLDDDELENRYDRLI